LGALPAHATILRDVASRFTNVVVVARNVDQEAALQAVLEETAATVQLVVENLEDGLQAETVDLMLDLGSAEALMRENPRWMCLWPALDRH